MFHVKIGMGPDESTDANGNCRGTLTQYVKGKGNQIKTSLICSIRGNKDEQHLSTTHSITNDIYL